jgi:hypothetical protein
MVLKTISVMSWLSVLLLEETRVPGENHRHVACLRGRLQNIKAKIQTNKCNKLQHLEISKTVFNFILVFLGICASTK